MHLESVSTRRVSFELDGPSAGENRVTVITGPNGSGKTEALVTAANFFAFPLQSSGGVSASTRPSKVVTQTFSPFARFKAPRKVPGAIAGIYMEEALGADDYAAVGMHKGRRYAAGSFARTVLESALFKLSEDTARAERIGSVLWNLGYEASFELVYRPKASINDLLAAHSENRLHDFLKLQERSKVGRTSALRREGEWSGIERLYEMLSTSMDVVEEVLRGKRPYKHSIHLDRSYGARNFAETQAFAVLRRLNLLSLTSCSLRRIDGPTVELANASSGQQQMLCSLLGVAAEIRDDALVVIDEPELSLHPTWQRQFLDDLVSVLRAVRGCHVLVATHSPVLVQRGQEIGLEVVALKMGKQIQLDLTPEAPSVEEALVEVFKAPVPNSLYLANEVAHLVNAAEEDSTFSNHSVLRLREFLSVYQSGNERLLLEAALAVVEAPEDE